MMTNRHSCLIRKEFPIFENTTEPLIYLDNAATAQKPEAVISRMHHFYSFENSNIHRGTYPLSLHASNVYESARETVRQWIGALSSEEIVFTKSSTEAVNLAASALFETHISMGDNVVVTELEHSSNYYPWQHHCARNGCAFRTAPADSSGVIRTEDIISRTDEKTKLIAVTGMSNATGFVPELAKIVRQAHARKILVFVDASQLIVHERINMQELGCDLLCFSGHKLYGPMGIGVLYGRSSLLREMAPFHYGGDMVVKGDGNRIEFRQDPGKYEAGTQNVAGALGLEAALSFLETWRFEEDLLPYEQELAGYLHEQISLVPGVRKIGPARQISTICSFTMENCGAYDIGIYLASKGIAVRTGAHCAYPLMKRLRQESTVRVSLAFYNTFEEIDCLISALRRLSERVL